MGASTVRRATPVAAVALATLMLAPAASAAPAPFEYLLVDCPGYGQVELTSPGNGAFTPGFIGGTNQLLIPHAVSYTVTVDGQVSSGSATKAEPEPDDMITCTFDATFRSGGTTYHLVGEVAGVVRGEP